MFWVILGAGLVVLALAGILVWWSIPWLSRRMIHHLLTRPMSDTWAELYLSMRSTTPVVFSLLLVTSQYR